MATDSSSKLSVHSRILSELTHGVIVTRTRDARILYANPVFERMLGYGPGELAGQHISIVNAPWDLSPEARAAEIIAALRENRFWSGEIRNRRKDGSVILCRANSSTFDDPEWGEVWISEHLDITRSRQIEVDLEESQTRLQAIVDNTTAVIYMKDLDGRYQLVNRRYTELFQITHEDVRGKTDLDIFPEEIARALRENDLAVTRTGRAHEFDETVPLDGTDHAYISIKFPLFRASGEVYAVCGISTDITDRKVAERRLQEAYASLERRVEERTQELSASNRQLEEEIVERRRAEAHQLLMTTELDHRVKNTLATVVALADETLSSSSSLEAFRASFLGRIGTLARSHEALAQGQWESVNLRAAARLVLAPFEGRDSARIAIEGPSARLPARAALPVCLSLHELGTNALKYGALSRPEGKVRVQWHITREQRIDLTWTEVGGPPVAKPDRFGSGLDLLRALIEDQLGGRVSLTFAKEGLECRLQIPPSIEISAAPTTGGSRESGTEASQPRQRRHKVLIVEDDRLQANMMTRLLMRLGYEPIGPARSVAEGLRLITELDVESAILDINLGAESSDGIADALSAKGRSFVYVTGYAARASVPARFADVPRLAKPIEPGDLEKALKICLGQAPRSA